MKTLNLFKDFNIGYEKLTKALKLNFDTSYFFQLIYMIYANEIKINKSKVKFRSVWRDKTSKFHPKNKPYVIRFKTHIFINDCFESYICFYTYFPLLINICKYRLSFWFINFSYGFYLSCDENKL